ncbi:MAG: magnesium-translocating P-type ATPase [Clostridium sp.]
MKRNILKKVKVEKETNTGFIKDRLVQFGILKEKELLTMLKTEKQGISQREAEKRIEAYGYNEISYGNGITLHKRLFDAFINPFTLVLIALAIVSFFTDYVIPASGDKDLTTVTIITVMVTLSGVLRIVQEGKSNKAGEKLKEMIKTTSAVMRDGKEIEIPMKDIVVGDIIKLNAGDMIPADVRIIFSKDLFVSESSMTGESEAVEKFSKLSKETRSKGILSHFELENLAFMGTNVISGTATAVVVATGNSTVLGSMADTITEKRELTNFDKGVNSVSFLLIKFMAIMVPIVFVINGVTKGDWLEALLFSISVAVGLTPEMLPMLVTTNLAKGAVKMAKYKTVVKNLNSIQNFGAMDVLCTDKTGTLTEDKIVLENHLDIHGNEDIRVLKHGYLNSYFQTGLRNLLDVAILKYGDAEGFYDVAEMYTKVDEIPFDFARRRMSVVLKDKEGKTQLITKGAIEEMLEISAYAEYKGEILELTDSIRKEILDTVDDLNANGMRVIGVAQKNNPSSEESFSVKDESNMVLMGYISFLDPPKESAKYAIEALNDYGVEVKILTGDNEKVTKYVCKQVGIDVSNIILGSEVEDMTDHQLKEAVENTNIFAKLSPAQKARVVSKLKDNGHVVGFMGDGINDAPAMRKSDVGISVDTAVDIAKESADIILLEKNLMVLQKGVEEGRKTFANIIKYIKMTASSNFGNIFSVLVASAFLPFLPMLPIQLLILNLIYDISCVAIPWDNVDREYLKKPRTWDASSIGSFMRWFGPTSSIFDITTYILMYFVICPAVLGGNFGDPGVNSVLFIALFNAGWFIESLWTQTLVIHMIRTAKIPFIQSRASKLVILFTTIALAIGTIIPYTPLGVEIGMTSLPAIYFAYLIGTIATYMVVVNIVKKIYIKRFGDLL